MPTRHVLASPASKQHTTRMPLSGRRPRSSGRGRSPQVLLTAAVMAAVVAALPAQVPPGLQFAELGKRHLPATWANGIAYGDLDGDGDVDLILAQNGQNRLLLNDGSGVFVDATATRLPAGGGMSVRLGDLDGDGDLDLVSANAWGANGLYRNDGTGTFTDVSNQLPASAQSGSHEVALGDVDGDGDLDIVWVGGATQLHVNVGAGTFTDVSSTQLPAAPSYLAAAELGDIDGDGDLDLVGGNGLLVNNGAGTFVDVTATQWPGGFGDAVALGDVDNDGDLDIVASTYSLDRLYLNNGVGSFLEVTATHFPALLADGTTSISLGDVDQDGDLDIVFGKGQYYGSRGQEEMYLNDGTGHFANATVAQLPYDDTWTRATALCDVDGDGDLDMVAGNVAGTGNWESRLYLNDGLGSFIDTTVLRAGSQLDFDGSSSIAMGDIDGDGDLDFVIGAIGQDRLFLNGGSGAFTDVTAARMPPTPMGGWTLGVALGDVDGDGDLDLILNGNRLYRNNGAGFFTPSAGLPPIAQGSWAIALGDVDGDGDLDLVLACSGQNRLYENNGSGVFADVTTLRLPADTDDTRAVALGDVDGDGDLDIVFGNADFSTGTNTQDRLCLNNGLGFFADATASLPIDTDQTMSIALGDVDGDGDLDLVTGNLGQNRLRLNNGSGVFTDATASRLPVDNDATTSVALGDTDLDGDIDIVFGNRNAAQTRLYRNAGGVFTDASATSMPANDEPTSAVALADVDADGDLDLVVAKSAACSGGPMPSCSLSRDHVYSNLLRQLDAPHLLRRGHPYTLDVYSRRYGPTSALDLALPYLSTTRLSIPVPPFGILGIDPMAPLPLVLIPQPAGIGTVTWMLPNNPAFVGIKVFAQALLLQGPTEIRLTNVTADVILQ